jgi:lipopolysaccharide/colanic/teichoic acid biosynthesis glycosyltransferase
MVLDGLNVSRVTAANEARDLDSHDRDLTVSQQLTLREKPVFKRLGAISVATVALAIAIPLAAPANAAPAKTDTTVSYMKVVGGLGCC